MLAFTKKYDQIWNNNDAAALAALFTDDAIEVTNIGPIYGRKALEKNWEDLFQNVHFSDHVSTVDQYSPHAIGNAGKEVWMNGEYSMTLKGQNFGPVEQKGYWCLILVRDGDAWKPRLQIWNIAQPPTPPATSRNGGTRPIMASCLTAALALRTSVTGSSLLACCLRSNPNCGV